MFTRAFFSFLLSAVIAGADEPKAIELNLKKPETLKDKQVGRLTGKFTALSLHPTMKPEQKGTIRIDGVQIDHDFFAGSVQLTPAAAPPMVLIRTKPEGLKAGEVFEFDEIVKVSIHKFTDLDPEAVKEAKLTGKKVRYATIYVITPQPKK